MAVPMHSVEKLQKLQNTILRLKASEFTVMDKFCLLIDYTIFSNQNKAWVPALWNYYIIEMTEQSKRKQFLLVTVFHYL